MCRPFICLSYLSPSSCYVVDAWLYLLKINSLSVPDYGTYMCATSVEGVSEKTDTMPVRLTVLSPPKVRLPTLTAQCYCT